MPKVPFWVFIILAILYLSATRVDVMDIDASQYAEISRSMMESGDYLHIYNRGQDYLDKPPFLFWASAVSMKIFGVSNFGYKFPSILFALWALFATFRLARLLYNERTGRMAALVLGCCQGMFLMTNDVRTDTILMSWTITAVWLIKEWDVKRKLWYLLAGAAAIACGMMTKGPIALMVPVFCFATDWAVKREWRKFFRWEYLICVVVIGVLLIPMSIGLYQQFDLHPEKVIDGQKGVSGLKFFFWTQSFGRLTGENMWSNNAPFSFLFENMLWSFLPWIILFVVALVLNVWRLAKQKFRLPPEQEWITTGGFILAYLSLASSQYQLPHYIFVVFPLAAIMVAALINEFFEGRYKKLYQVMRPVQIGIGALLLIAALMTFAYVFPAGIMPYALWSVGVIIWLYVVFSKRIMGKILWTSAAAIMIANAFMTNQFYYTLMKYQAGSNLGRYIYRHNIPASAIRIYNIEDPLDAVHFYAQRPIIRDDSSSSALKSQYLITGTGGIKELNEKGYGFSVLVQGEFFKASELTPDFINPATRPKAVKPYYFVRLR
jgi:4-amino-4-deoxy-L-arabinose transferase-like glycosyltransferase